MKKVSGYDWYLREGEKEKEKMEEVDPEGIIDEGYVRIFGEAVCVNGVWGIIEWSGVSNDIDEILMMPERFKNILS